MTSCSHPELPGLYHQTEVEVPKQGMQLGLQLPTRQSYGSLQSNRAAVQLRFWAGRVLPSHFLLWHWSFMGVHWIV